MPKRQHARCAGDPTATGNVLTNDTDVDTGHALTVAAVGAWPAMSAHAVAGTYGSVTINTDGSYTYTLDNARRTPRTIWRRASTSTDVFTYTTTDEHGATSTRR